LELFNFDGCAPNSIKNWVATTEKRGAPKIFFGASRQNNHYHYCAPPLLKSFRRLFPNTASVGANCQTRRTTRKYVAHKIAAIGASPYTFMVTNAGQFMDGTFWACRLGFVKPNVFDLLQISN